MDAKQFRAPVAVMVDGVSQQISTAQEALVFLSAWPRSGPVHQCAVRCCQAALAGETGADQARTAFESFARITGLLPRRHVAHRSMPLPSPAAGQVLRPAR